jgi:hypothetical protein
VHALPSSQFIGVWMQPVALLHVSAVHASASSQLTIA